MAKAIGLIGNFKGKVGNMVGYQIPDSNTGNTQGIRIYQPVVKNPKTSAQAEQRAKLAPINATYRALKSIIDRGNEGLPYGNKSRLAWLKQAFKAENMPWIEKGLGVNYPVGCLLSKGSLGSVSTFVDEDQLAINVAGLAAATDVSTIAKVTAIIIGAYPFLKDGDQLTFVSVKGDGGSLQTTVVSMVLDSTSTAANSILSALDNKLERTNVDGMIAGAIIVSREGENGQHLRSTESLTIPSALLEAAPYNETSKTAAVQSYMASAAGSTDWAEESIQ